MTAGDLEPIHALMAAVGVCLMFALGYLAGGQ